MDGDGTLFSAILALGVGMVLIGLLFGAALVIAGAVMVLWAVFTVVYWTHAFITWLQTRKAR